ncbi:craniofacial development protein 2-like [Palaemon carinicauda]|uniref:craniofacial development protein 2-like n=1 Tax=Palaemon carinicauda TaxID=392227 RepID=UPI0035B677CB
MAHSPRRSRVVRIHRFINTKEKLDIVKWNVRNINHIGKLHQVDHEFMKCTLDIFVLTETRCKNTGKDTLDQGNVYIYSGRTDGVGREGVGIMMTPRAEKALSEWRAVKSRLLVTKFKSKECNKSIKVYYASTK